MKNLILLCFLFQLNSALAQCDTITELNQNVLNYAKSKLGKKVDRGECWDLAKFALDEAGATWDGMYKYGRKLSKTECLMPGDIIQFENVVVEFKDGDLTYKEAMQHHTSIISRVYDQDHVELIHQNTAYSGRKVGTSDLKFSNIKKGKYTIYRPEKID